MTEWVQQVHQYHLNGMSYGKIAKVMGMTKNKVLSAHRKMRFGMDNTKFYKKKREQEVVLTSVITLPKISGINNPKYTYKEFAYA